MPILKTIAPCFAILALLTLSGCWDRESPEKESGKTEIVYWRHFYGPEDTAVKALIRTFEKQNPDITVNYQSMPFKGYREKLNTSLYAGNGPDIINIHNSWAYGFIKSGLVRKIPGTVIPPEKLEQEFIPIVRSFSLNNAYYGLPVGGGCLALFINTEQAKDAGLDLNSPPTNWKDLEKWALQLSRKKDGRIVRSGFACGGTRSQSWNYLVEGLFRQNGAKIISRDRKEVLWNNAKGLEAFRWYMGFVTRHKIFDLSFAKTFQIFAERRCSMIVEGNWILQKLSETAPELEYTVVPLPGRKQNATYGSCWGNCVTTVAEGPQESAAFRFLKFITSRKSALFWTEQVGELPVYKDILDTGELGQKHPGLTPFIRSMSFAYSSIKKDETLYKKAIVEAIERVALRNIPPEDALNRSAQKINRMLRNK